MQQRAILRLDKPRVTKFCAALDILVARNLIRFWKKPSYSEAFFNPNDEEMRAFLELPVEMCAILLERDQGDSYQLDFLRSSPQAVEWILQLTPSMLDALFENFHAQAETSVTPPFLAVVRSRAHAAMASFCFGVMPPSAMFGRS